MEKHWFILLIFFLAIIILVILLIIRNRKDRKGLFKKLPGDAPDPKTVKSEFD
jgi:hypothetical protein